VQAGWRPWEQESRRRIWEAAPRRCKKSRPTGNEMPRTGVAKLIFQGDGGWW
jgi:hypothetical protein